MSKRPAAAAPSPAPVPSTPAEYRALVPADADLVHILEDLRPLALPVEILVFDPENANEHDEDSIRVISGSLGLYEQHKPLVVNLRSGRPVVIIGNGMLESITGLGWKYVAVVLVDEDDDKAGGRALADNRTAQFGQFQNERLFEQLSKLQEHGVPVEVFGFGPDDMEELRKLVEGDELRVPDGVPQEDVSDAVQTVVVEIHCPPGLADEVLPRLKAIAQEYEARGLTFNVA